MVWLTTHTSCPPPPPVYFYCIYFVCIYIAKPLIIISRVCIICMAWICLVTPANLTIKLIPFCSHLVILHILINVYNKHDI